LRREQIVVGRREELDRLVPAQLVPGGRVVPVRAGRRRRSVVLVVVDVVVRRADGAKVSRAGVDAAGRGQPSAGRALRRIDRVVMAQLTMSADKQNERPKKLWQTAASLSSYASRRTTHSCAWQAHSPAAAGNNAEVRYNKPAHVPVKSTPSSGGSGPLSKTLVLGPTQVSRPNGISIRSAVFAQLTCGVGVNYRSTQPCIPPGSLNRVLAFAGGKKAGCTPLPGGR